MTPETATMRLHGIPAAAISLDHGGYPATSRVPQLPPWARSPICSPAPSPRNPGRLSRAPGDIAVSR